MFNNFKNRFSTQATSLVQGISFCILICSNRVEMIAGAGIAMKKKKIKSDKEARVLQNYFTDHLTFETTMCNSIRF